MIPQSAELEVPLIKELAKRYNKTITVFDLETTGFLASPTFGVTEVAAVHIHPDGSVTEQATLVNPEYPISPAAAIVTGISDDMVADYPNWGELCRDHLHQWATNNIVLGFNNIDFDFKAVIKENTRYGQPNTVFVDGRDVRSYWKLKSGTAKGKLTEVAAKYDISPEGAHRAIYDVRMTAKVLERFLLDHGIDFFDAPEGKLNPSKRFIKSVQTDDNPTGFIDVEERILEIIDRCGYSSLKRLTFLTGVPEFDLTQLLGNLMYDGRLDPDIVSDPNAQAWLLRRLPYTIEETWSGENRGKLKPLMTSVGKYPPFVDYLQLRVFLKQNGYFAALDKSKMTSEPMNFPKVMPEDEPSNSSFDAPII